MKLFRIFSLLTSIYLLLFIVDVNTFQFSFKLFSNLATSELFEEEDAEEKSKIEAEENEFYSASKDNDYLALSKVQHDKIGTHAKDWLSVDYVHLFSPPPEA